MPDNSSAFEREVISAAVDLGPQDFEVADVLAPKTAQQLAQKDMLDQLLAGAGFGVVGGFGLKRPVRVSISIDRLRFKVLRRQFASGAGKVHGNETVIPKQR